MSGLKIVPFVFGHRGPHDDSSRAGCGPRAGRCAPLFYRLYTDILHAESVAEVLSISRIITVNIPIIAFVLLWSRKQSAICYFTLQLQLHNYNYIITATNAN